MRDRGQIIERTGDRFLVRVYLGRSPEGKRQYSSKLVKGTQKDAQQTLTTMLGEIDDQTFSGRSSMTLGSYLKRWLESKQDVAERTKRDYTERLAQDITPYLGALRLKDITPAHIERVYVLLTEERKLSPRTIRYSHAVLHAALQKALKWGFLGRNPASLVDLPKMSRMEMQHLSPIAVRTLLDKTEGDPLHPLWVLLLTTGLRPGEALALRWEDLDGRTLTIVRALQQVEKNKYAVRDTKTQKSRRPVTLPESASGVLKAYRKRTGALTGWMFPSRAATPLDLANVRRAWKAALKVSGLPETIRLYDTRHTHASHLLKAGVNPKVVAERLGHSSVNLTLNTYSHVVSELDAEAADKVDLMIAKEATNG